MVEFQARFRETPACARLARERIVDYARTCGFSAKELTEIGLAVGEALANAVEHGNVEEGELSVLCRFEDGILTIEVEDDGSGFDVSRQVASVRDPQAVRGFGIEIMRAVMDGVQFEARGNRVCLRKQRER
ncbi:MAG: ATP-binding protein [Vulcanimicrobiaceae bacterium]